MIQPTLTNRQEYKIVCVGGKPLVRHTPKKKASKSKAFLDDTIDELFYADLALRRLRANCPALIHDGLLRIDLMKSERRQMIVLNEVESMEAMYTSTVKGQRNADDIVLGKITNYWVDTIRDLLNKL